MPYSEWRPGISLPAPVYLDASVVVASFATNERRYKQATALLGELLGDQSQIFISLLTVSEALWGLARLSYQELYGQKQKKGAHFGTDIFRRHAEEIFAKHGGRMTAVYEWLHDWRAAGIRINVLPPDDPDVFERIAAVGPVYMRTFGLGSADAFHLATAETAAASFVTTDGEFEQAQASPLEIFRLTGASTQMV